MQLITLFLIKLISNYFDSKKVPTSTLICDVVHTVVHQKNILKCLYAFCKS